jgi:hypothetical protein
VRALGDALARSQVTCGCLVAQRLRVAMGQFLAESDASDADEVFRAWNAHPGGLRDLLLAAVASRRVANR